MTSFLVWKPVFKWKYRITWKPSAERWNDLKKSMTVETTLKPNENKNKCRLENSSLEVEYWGGREERHITTENSWSPSGGKQCLYTHLHSPSMSRRLLYIHAEEDGDGDKQPARQSNTRTC